MIESSPEHAFLDKPAGVFVRRADLMSADDQLLLRAASRVVMDADEGRLRNQLVLQHVPTVLESTRTETSEPQAAIASPPQAASLSSADDLEFFNGSGGFAADGREYIVRTADLDAAGPVDQCGGERDVRICLHRIGRRLHLVGEQPRQPADAVAKRSGWRSTGRSGVHP